MTDHLTPDELLARLGALGIDVTTHHHAPVFTVEQAKQVRGSLSGTHCKNLFLRNKKGRMWLVVLTEDHPLDLTDLGDRLGSGRLSFASERRLAEHLGVVPGAVTPFAVVNDREGSVAVVIERTVLERDPVHFHPLDNSMTTALTGAGLLRFLDAVGHPPLIIDLA